MKTKLRFLALCLLGLTLAGCKTGAPSTALTADPTIVPLPSIEREVLPDGSEVVVAPPPDGEAAKASEPRTLTEKITAFCTPKAPRKSNSNRVYENDSIPYTD